MGSRGTILNHPYGSAPPLPSATFEGLGPTATANSGDFVKAAPNPASGLHSLFAHLESLLKRARKGEGPLEEGLVHKVRVTCRRLRVVLTVLPPESLRETARPVRSCLGRLRRVAGEVRDCDVHLRLLEELDKAEHHRKPTGLIDALAMAAEVSRMSGADRIPRLLHRVDRLARGLLVV